MLDFKEMLEALYGNYKAPVVLISETGDTIWYNSAFEQLSNKNSSLIKEISDSVLKQNSPDGHISCGVGGSFRNVCFDGRRFILVEMNTSDSLAEFFADSRISDFSYDTDMLVRKSVTGISASCEMIEAYCGDEIRKEIRECLNYILSSCCGLLKSATLNSRLAAAVDENLSSSQSIDIDDFLTEIAEGCSRTLPGKCEAVYKDMIGERVKANRALLTCFVLGLLRPLLDNPSEEKCVLEISCKRIEERISVDFTTTATISQNHSADDDVNRIFAEKLDAEYSYRGNTLNITLNIVKSDDSLSFETDRLYHSDSVFSVYNVLLSGIEGFRKFYE
ncbi:MAG: hypothetical protein E7497_02815 [Ruminococcus sp.]|nr:hypothetical protein [Ruminococcus sp.]